MRRTIVVCATAAVWVVAVSSGLAALWNYQNEAGQAAEPPTVWPAASRIHPVAGQATLIMLLHPHCPCSRASLEELDRLMAQSGGAISPHLLFVKPPGTPEGWEHTDTWEHALAIPGAEVLVDEDGIEAHRFRAATSGQVILYGADGRLIFSGGMTAARGHAGDNEGLSAITALLAAGESDTDHTPVFGCPLNNPESEQRAMTANGI